MTQEMQKKNDVFELDAVTIVGGVGCLRSAGTL